VLSRAEVNFKDLVLPEWHHTSAASSTIFRRVTIRSEPSSLMANYIKIKRVELMQSCIATTVEENWILEKCDDIGEVMDKIRKLEREVEGRIDKDNALESKTTRDRCLLLLPNKRLKNYLLYEGGFLE